MSSLSVQDTSAPPRIGFKSPDGVAGAFADEKYGIPTAPDVAADAIPAGSTNGIANSTTPRTSRHRRADRLVELATIRFSSSRETHLVQPSSTGATNERQTGAPSPALWGRESPQGVANVVTTDERTWPPTSTSNRHS
jgi:hypothetical protein